MYETLYYAAMLRLPRHMSEAAKKERVFTVIRALGLDSCKDTIVGEAGFGQGFLSDGRPGLAGCDIRVACLAAEESMCAGFACLSGAACLPVCSLLTM